MARWRRLIERTPKWGTSVATKLAAVVMLVSILSLAAATIVGVTSGRALGRDLYEQKLQSERATSALDIGIHMGSLGRMTAARAASPASSSAIAAFAAGIEILRDEVDEAPDDEREAVTAALVASTYDPLVAAGRTPDLGAIVPDDPAAIHIQYRYVVDIGAVERPSDVDDAGDGSDWSAAHARYHPAFRSVVDDDIIVDLYLVEPDEATIVYSVTKGPDIATSLDNGPYSGSLLAAAVGEARAAAPGSVVIGDLGFYDPTIVRPVGAIAAPVHVGDDLAGIVVLLYDGAALTRLLTEGSTGDTADRPRANSYVIGADGLLRTEPRSLTTDRSAVLDSAVAAGLVTAAERNRVAATGTAVLTLRAPDATVAVALDGDVDVIERAAIDGSALFSTTQALAIPGLDWFVVSDIAATDATVALDRFEDVLVVGAAAFVVALTFWAVAWANRIMSPIRAISDRLAAMDPSVTPIEVAPRSPTEFHQLTASFASMQASLAEQGEQLASARAERLALMRRMLPHDVADRLAAGETQELEQVPQATVVVVVVTGLGDLIRSGDDASSRTLVGHLHAQLDDVGLVHGVDRVKIVGDAYFGVCGHDRPYIDHGPRVVAFAGDARNAVRAVADRSEQAIDIAAAVHTGPVTVGMAGGERLVYDVFGETVSFAHQLARQAATGDIVVSETTRRLLPDSVEVSAVVDGDRPVWRIDGDATQGIPS